MVTVSGNVLLLVLLLPLVMASLAATLPAPEAPPETTSVTTIAQDEDASDNEDVYKFKEAMELEKAARIVKKKGEDLHFLAKLHLNYMANKGKQGGRGIQKGSVRSAL